MDQCSEGLGVTQTEKLVFHAELNLDSVYQQIVDIALVIAFQHLLQVAKWMKNYSKPCKILLLLKMRCPRNIKEIFLAGIRCCSSADTS